MKKCKTVLLSLFILVICISCSEKPESLSKILRYNDGLKKIGIILGNIVNVRAKPSMRSKIVFQTRKGEKVLILDKTSVINRIGRFTDYWIKVKNIRNQVGYIFGAFIFDLKNLFDGVWGYITHSEWTFGIKFKTNRTFICKSFYSKHAFSGNSANNNNLPYYTDKFIGGYKIIGSRIYLYGRRASKFLKANELKVLNLFRYKRINILSKLNLKIEANLRKINKITQNLSFLTKLNVDLEDATWNNLRYHDFTGNRN